jgi:uncharacterized surface protein with fasciclin (FAS1) repeats
VVAGNLTAAALIQKIQEGKGKAVLTTVQGGTITLMKKGKKLMLSDANGNVATITIADVQQSNGVIHVIDTVVLP